MIGQKTVVHITINEQPAINLGVLALFEYISPIGDGEIKLEFLRKGSQFDRGDIAKIVSATSQKVVFSIITEKDVFTYQADLREVHLRSTEILESLVLKAQIV